MRERNKTANAKMITSSAAIVQSESIVEKIGESISGMGSTQLPKVAAASQSLGRRTGKENVMLQNFFNISRSERDNNSIISIMLKKSMPKPAAVKSPIKLDKQSIPIET
jgi:hypothetical protein